jgi:hypothetical protein
MSARFVPRAVSIAKKQVTAVCRSPGTTSGAYLLMALALLGHDETAKLRGQVRITGPHPVPGVGYPGPAPPGVRIRDRTSGPQLAS